MWRWWRQKISNLFQRIRTWLRGDSRSRQAYHDLADFQPNHEVASEQTIVPLAVASQLATKTKPRITLLRQGKQIELPEIGPNPKIPELSNLPRDYLDMIVGHLPNKALAAFNQCHFRLYYHTRSEFIKRVCFLVVRALEKDVSELKKMLEANPAILLEKTTTKSLAGRIYEDATPYECALREQDFELADILATYFDKFPCGAEERARQFHHVYPNGQIPNQAQFDLSEITSAISNAKPADIKAAYKIKDNGSALYWALHQFREAFAECIEREKYANPQHLLKAFQVYNDKSVAWNVDRRDLFWLQVKGYMQRFESARRAQIWAYSLSEVVENKRVAPRTFRFLSGQRWEFGRLVSISYLGITHHATHLSQGQQVPGEAESFHGPTRACWGVINLYRAIISSSNTILANLSQRYSQSKMVGNVIESLAK